MSDLAERLRQEAANVDASDPLDTWAADTDLLREAAARLDTWQALLEEVRTNNRTLATVLREVTTQLQGTENAYHMYPSFDRPVKGCNNCAATERARQILALYPAVSGPDDTENTQDSAL